MTSNPTDLIELLPCPFCGGEAWPIKHSSPYTDEYSVKCGEQGCCEVNEEYEDEAANAWNMRANTPTQQESELAEVRAERDALLQKPIDLAKMDSIDDDNGTPDKMIAYYWHQQAQDARAKSAQQESEIERLREALSAIMDVGGEINPSNYNHEDVCSLNNAFIGQFQIARAALSTTTDAPK